MPQTTDRIREYRRNWENEQCMRILLKIPFTSSIPDALKIMQYETGIAPTTYAKRALEEKLIAEGYMREKEE